MKLIPIEFALDHRRCSYEELLLLAQRVMYNLAMDRKLIGTEDLTYFDLKTKAQLEFYDVYKHGDLDHNSMYIHELEEEILINNIPWDLSHVYYAEDGRAVLVCYQDSFNNTKYFEAQF